VRSPNSSLSQPLSQFGAARTFKIKAESLVNDLAAVRPWRRCPKQAKGLWQERQIGLVMVLRVALAHGTIITSPRVDGNWDIGEPMELSL